MLVTAIRNASHPQLLFKGMATFAVSMQSETRLALTLTLSPRRGNPQRLRREKSLNGEPCPALEKVLPLPGGEGRREGERAFILHSSGVGYGSFPIVLVLMRHSQ